MSEQSNNTCPLEGCKFNLKRYGLYNHLIQPDKPHHGLNENKAIEIFDEGLIKILEETKVLGSSTLQSTSHAKQASPAPSEQTSVTNSEIGNRRKTVKPQLEKGNSDKTSSIFGDRRKTVKPQLEKGNSDKTSSIFSREERRRSAQTQVNATILREERRRSAQNQSHKRKRSPITKTSEKMPCNQLEGRFEGNTYSKSGHESGKGYLPEVEQLLKDHNRAFRCDAPTEAKGNCFPNAIMQQLHRPEIRSTLSDETKLLSENDHHLRTAIIQFIRATLSNPQSPYYNLFDEARNTYTIMAIEQGFYDSRDWDSLLEYMSTEGKWFDDQFMKFTSCFLRKDIMCYTATGPVKFCGSPKDKEGDFHSDRPCNCFGEPLQIVNIRNMHFQSILPLQTPQEGENQEKNNVENDNESVTSTVNDSSPIKRKHADSPILTPVKKLNLQESFSEAEDEATTDVTPIKRNLIATLEIESPLKRLNNEEVVPKSTWGNFRPFTLKRCSMVRTKPICGGRSLLCPNMSSA